MSWKLLVFMCKQFWLLAFNKEIDNLKTNHQVDWGLNHQEW